MAPSRQPASAAGRQPQPRSGKGHVPASTVALFVIVVSVLPVYLAQRLSSDSTGITAGR